MQADRLRLAGKKPEDIAREEAEEQLHIERMRQKSLLSNDEDDDDDDEDEDNDVLSLVLHVTSFMFDPPI